MKKLFLTVFVLLIAIMFGYSQEEKSGTKVLISTSFGDIKILLYDKTPLHRDNFIKLVESKYYDDLLFHRVIRDFMIQGGDPDSRDSKPRKQLGKGGPDYKIPFEYVPEYFHKKGALAAAREGDNVNPEKASSGSQFYIVTGRTFTEGELDIIQKRYGITYTQEQIETYKTIGGYPPLDKGYTVFGEVIEGIEVAEKISQVPRDGYDRPLENIKMTLTIIK